MSDTPSSRTRSATRTAPSSRTRSRMNAWRWRASIRPRPPVDLTRHDGHPRSPLLIERLPPNRQKVNVFQQPSHRNRCDALTRRLRVGTIRLILSDFVGQRRRRSIPAMDEPIRIDPVTRRTVLKGIVGAAGLVSIPAIIAACSSTASSGAPGAGGSAAVGSVSIGSYHTDPGEPEGMAAVNAAFTAATGIAVEDEHGRPQHVPEPDRQLPRRTPGHGLHRGSPASA